MMIRIRAGVRVMINMNCELRRGPGYMCESASSASICMGNNYGELLLRFHCVLLLCCIA